MDEPNMDFMTSDDDVEATEFLEMMSLLSRLQPPPRGEHPMRPPGRGPGGDTSDTRISIDELLEDTRAGTSSREPGFSFKVDEGHSAAPGDGLEDWRTRGLLNTVKMSDTAEIERLRGLVDTRLHAAVRAQDLTALCNLLADGASPAALDWEGRTPLHFCVIHRLKEPFKVLLSAPGAADARDASGWPLLHATLLHGWREGTRLALAAGARVDATGPCKLDIFDVSPEHYNENRYPKVTFIKFQDSLPRTVIEVAMLNDMAMLDPILAVAKDSGVIDCLNRLGHTPLHTAVWLHKRQAIQALLMHGASPYKVSDKEDSVLHVAIHNPDILEFLLTITDVKSTLNNEGLAPEHLAVRSQNPESLKLLLNKFKNTRVRTGDEGNTPLHLAAIKEGDEMAKIILERDLGVGAMLVFNNQGYTPLHLAAKHNNKEVAALLLLNGANLSTKTEDENKETVLELISTHFYDSVNFLERLFDGFIYNMDGIGRTSVHTNYEVLTDGKDMSQIKVLEEFVKCDQNKALIHPLIESLLYLKWKHFQPLFFALLCFYGIFLVLFNSLIVCIYYLADRSNDIVFKNNSLNASAASDEGTGSDGFHGAWYWVLIVLTYLSILTLLFQEAIFIYLKRGRHFKSVETWVKLFGLVLCALAPPLAALARGPWARHAACAALLLAWLQAMFLVSRFSRWGYYVLIFGKVAANVFKILVTAVFLVIAFAFCFMIQYHSSAPFEDPFAAFVKTLVMMSSEFEYENLFDENHDAQLEDTRTVVRLLFMCFVIFLAIVLMNFMIGIAVSDINDLNETGKIRRLEKQVELLSTFEPLAYEGFLSKWFLKIFGDKSYHRSMYTFRGNKSTWQVKIHKTGLSEEGYTIQIRSSKLYNAIVETPSKQQQQDQEAAKYNSEKPYRSQHNALNNALISKSAGLYLRGNEDLVRRKDNHFDSIVYKQYFHSLVDSSSKIKTEIEELKEYNKYLNSQIARLNAMSYDILESVKSGRNWAALVREARRPRIRVKHRTKRKLSNFLPKR